MSSILPADNNDDLIEETVLLIIQLQNGTVVFDRLQRSNFSILGLRTARLSNKTAAQIFGTSNIKDISRSSGSLLFCVVTRRSCVSILSALRLPLVYSSKSVSAAESEIPKLFAELLVL
jgi:hypothetical protein